MKIIPDFNAKGRGAGVVPRQCAVTNRGTDPEGFIDTGNMLSGWDREVYISIAAAKEMGRMVGMYSEDEVAAIKGELEELKASFAEATEALDDILQLQSLTEKVAAA